MHSSTQISHAGIIFDADSELKVRFDFLLFLGIKSESYQSIQISKKTGFFQVDET